MEQINQKASFCSRAEIEAELRARAYKDEAFGQALKSDPRTVLEREYPHWFPDGKIPEGVTIRIIEEEADSLNLVLLSRGAGSLTSISEDELSGIQGGGLIDSTINRGLGRIRRPEVTRGANGPAKDAQTAYCSDDTKNTVCGCNTVDNCGGRIISKF